MSQQEILWPVVALAGLTYLVTAIIPIRRFAAVGRKEVGPHDFALGESSRVPAKVALANRNYMNLLELPVLFYVVAICLFVTNSVDALALGLAWAYVAARVLHSLIHLTYNKVMHRLLAFAISNFILMALWGVFGLKLWAMRA